MTIAIVRPAVAKRASAAAPLIAIGILDISGSTLYAAATTQGLLAIVGMLAALYPVMTVILARVLLKERLTASQRLGTAIALAGVVLIGAGA